jgi:hypothetical protein
VIFDHSVGKSKNNVVAVFLYLDSVCRRTWRSDVRSGQAVHGRASGLDCSSSFPRNKKKVSKKVPFEPSVGKDGHRRK